MTTLNLATQAFELSRNAFGKLVLTRADGEVIEDVVPVRVWPIACPDEGIALMSGDGHEAAWIAHLRELPAPQRQLIEEELAAREFMPEIRRIVSVTSFATPCTWLVETDRGQTNFVLRGEEDIRRIGQQGLLIADSHGIQFLIREMAGLDRGSRKILDRFL